MFRGSQITRVDEKGRLKVPADFKRRLDEVYGPQFYITSKDGKRVEIYPIREWEKLEEKLAAVPNSNAAKQRFLDVTNYYGQMAEMDNQGRLLLPQVLREAANVVTEVSVSGKQTYLEVVNHEERKMQATPISAEELAALEAFGI